MIFCCVSVSSNQRDALDPLDPSRGPARGRWIVPIPFNTSNPSPRRPHARRHAIKTTCFPPSPLQVHGRGDQCQAGGFRFRFRHLVPDHGNAPAASRLISGHLRPSEPLHQANLCAGASRTRSMVLAPPGLFSQRVSQTRARFSLPSEIVRAEERPSRASATLGATRSNGSSSQDSTTAFSLWRRQTHSTSQTRSTNRRQHTPAARHPE